MPKIPLPLVAVTGALLLVTATVIALSIDAEASGFVANAGPDQTVECTSPAGALVRLDGSTSTVNGTNDSLASVQWYEGDALLGTGLTLDHTFSIGTHEVSLHLMNASNDTRADNVTIRVVDTTAPTILATAPATLWPPNHKMRTIDVDVTTSDTCSAVSWILESVTSDEADDGRGDGHTTGDVQGADIGTADTSVTLRSERAGPGDGRSYTLVYIATDNAGNIARSTVVVNVPHGEV